MDNNTPNLNTESNIENNDSFEEEKKRALDKIQKEMIPKAEVFTPEYFLYSCNGRYSNGQSRSTIGVSLLGYTGDLKEENVEQLENEFNYREKSTRITKQGEISFIPTDGNIIVDIKFRTALEPEFQLLWKQLEEYGDMLTNYNYDTNNEFPILVFNIVSDTYTDEYYMTFANPIFWVLQPPTADTEECSMIRMLVSDDSFNIVEIPEDIDLDKLDAEASRVYNTILTEK